MSALHPSGTSRLVDIIHTAHGDYASIQAAGRDNKHHYRPYLIGEGTNNIEDAVGHIAGQHPEFKVGGFAHPVKEGVIFPTGQLGQYLQEKMLTMIAGKIYGIPANRHRLNNQALLALRGEVARLLWFDLIYRSVEHHYFLEKGCQPRGAEIADDAFHVLYQPNPKRKASSMEQDMVRSALKISATQKMNGPLGIFEVHRLSLYPIEGK